VAANVVPSRRAAARKRSGCREVGHRLPRRVKERRGAIEGRQAGRLAQPALQPRAEGSASGEPAVDLDRPVDVQPLAQVGGPVIRGLEGDLVSPHERGPASHGPAPTARRPDHGQRRYARRNEQGAGLRQLQLAPPTGKDHRGWGQRRRKQAHSIPRLHGGQLPGCGQLQQAKCSPAPAESRRQRSRQVHGRSMSVALKNDGRQADQPSARTR
jgi:hypothetical protein